MTRRRWLCGVSPAILLGSGGFVEAGVVRNVTDPRDGRFEITPAAIDAAGTAAFFSSSARFASNSQAAAQIVRCDLPEGPCAAVTSFDDGIVGQVNVSDDGAWLRDGTNLRQLTFETTGAFTGLSIDDGGTRIVFGHDVGGTKRVYAIEADGSGRRQLGAARVVDPVIAGDGITVVFVEMPAEILRAIDWVGTNPRLITGGRDPVVRYDAKFLWYVRSDGEIGSVNTSSLEATRLTFSSGAIENDRPVVSGSGNRVVFRARGGAHPGGVNTNGGYELMSMDGSGGVLRQLTLNEVAAWESYVDLTPDGSRVVFTSHRRTGEPGLPADLYRIQADGQTIVFTTFYPNGGATIQRVFAEGTGLLQLSPAEGNESPQISADGSGLTSIASGVHFREPRLADTGGWVVFQGGGCGRQPEQVRRVRIDGTGGECITSDPDYRAWLPDISNDGESIVYGSNADPLGTNTDHNSEMFAYRPASAERRQLTNATSGQSGNPRISSDGTWVYFFSTAPYFDGAVGPRSDLHRIRVTGGPVERVAGLHAAGTALGRAAVNADGSRVVFTGAANASDVNPDGDSEVFLADFAVPAQIQAFFFLYRGTQGLGDTAMSWGRGSGGEERVVGAGGCGAGAANR